MTGSMPLKIKIMLLAILPMVMVTTLTTWLGSKGARLLSEQEIEIFEESLLVSKRRELKHYVEMAQASIRPVIEQAGSNPAAAKAEVKRILHELTFGEDGYFFAYNREGINLVHPVQPELVGEDLIDLRDYNGEFIIRPLLRIAAEGGGYHRYLWKKPSRDVIEEKLGYVVQIPEWGWMFGTGLYIDDISTELNKIRTEVNKNIRENLFTVSVIVLGTSLIIVLLGLAINLHESRLADGRLRALAHRSILFHVHERRRFSRELHDGINQLMVSVLYRMELAQRKLTGGDAKGLEDLQAGRAVLNEAIQEVRRISHDLRPSILDDLGLASALGNLLDQFSERTAIRIRRELELPDKRLPEDIEMTLYRLIQEALTNVERHADASELIVKLDHQRDAVKLDLRDNGRGFDPDANRHLLGIGLRNMRERVELLGGDYKIDSGIGEGTRIRVRLPIKAP
ncbi:cache domain-containing protein [Marinobacterium litorale]|jgi:two-component system NarL family sensor kinase|uniref:cache domain-containing protein n=1 Tax=Marinobacterium litorale TaxID=404770 RepID=UPI0004036253|nr:cache domain-containing protein [Marinobacterium litorale]